MDPLTVHGRMTRSFAAATTGLVIALALQIAGFATPGWTVKQYGWTVKQYGELDGMKVEFGLWTTKVCGLGTCVSVVPNTNYDKFGYRVIDTGMREYQIETSIALGLLVIAISLFSFLRCGSGSGNLNTIVFCTVFCTLISGILAVTAAGKHGNDIRRAHDYLVLTDSESPYKTPYSLILTGLGGILAGVMSAVILFAVKPWMSDARPPPSYEMPAHPNVSLLLG